MKIDVFSRDHIKRLIKNNKVDFNKVNVISINSLCIRPRTWDSELDEMQFLMGRDNPNVLFLEFDDVTIEEAERINSNSGKFRVEPMTVEQANQIIDFILKTFNQDKDLFVHCTAGISRSGAVGLFANQFINRYIKPNEEEFKFNLTHGFLVPPIPNTTVIQLLNANASI